MTPMMSMINALCHAGSSRDVYFAFALRHGGDHVFKKHLRTVIARCPNIRMHVLYENPRPEDAPGIDYDRVGRIDGRLLRELLPSLDMEYYLCGPSGMMNAISETLMEQGVPRERIKTESFGPSNLSFRSALAAEEASTHSEKSPELTVTFAKSGKTVSWTRDAATVVGTCRHEWSPHQFRLPLWRLRYLHDSPDFGHGQIPASDRRSSRSRHVPAMQLRTRNCH